MLWLARRIPCKVEYFAVFLAGRTLLKGTFTASQWSWKEVPVSMDTSPHKDQKWQFNAQRFFGTNLYVQTWNSNSQRAHQAPSWVLLIWKKGTLTIFQHLAMLCLCWEQRTCLPSKEERNINWKWNNSVPKILILHQLHSNLKLLYTSSQYLMIVKSIPYPKGRSPGDGTQEVGWRPPIFWK